MSPERLAQIEEVFHAIRESAPEARAGILAALQPDIRREVESLLSSDGRSGLLDGPPPELSGISPTYLAPGTLLGPYRIEAPIGSGGMGQVFRATDTRLGRAVAIKTSQERFSDRFGREARAISALNHPNVCTLHDVGSDYLVMELIEGPTLADRIAEGPIALDEALHIARQIADALEAAHEKNIVHRDLKPGNIKLRPDGSVKVLDFGLAKSSLADQHAPFDSPTLVHLPTRAGVILGTPAYMAPEQARGKTVDRRADIWSFGVVLYEMVTGRRPFQGEDVTDTLASVVKSEPDLAPVPAKLLPLIDACLQKDAKKRLRDIGDWHRLLTEQVPLGLPLALERSRWIWPTFTALMAVAASVALLLHLREAPTSLNPIQFSISPPEGKALVAPAGKQALISPDGHYVVFWATGAVDSTPILWLQPLGSLDARPLPGTETASWPFWSPDSRSLAFFDGQKLKRIDIFGGSTTALCDVPGKATGGAWGANDTVVFTQADGLYRVSASGGIPEQIVKRDPAYESGFAVPQLLPGGKVLYHVDSTDPARRGAWITALGNSEKKTLLLATDRGTKYATPQGDYPGELLWMRGQTLMAQSLDLTSLRLGGEATPVAENVLLPIEGSDDGFDVSNAGIVVYTSFGSSTRIMSLGRGAAAPSELGHVARFINLNLSPDGKSAAITADPGNGYFDIWIWDLARGVRTRFTSTEAREINALWSPDAKTIVFNSNRQGHYSIYRKQADGSGQEELIYEDGLSNFPHSFSPDGKALLFFQQSKGIRILHGPLGPVSEISAEPLGRTEFQWNYVQFSPDGKWVAYTSDESGTAEVYATPFPELRGRVRISTHGGSRPRWRRDGREILYLAGDNRITATEVRGKNQVLEIGPTHSLTDPIIGGTIGGGGTIANLFDILPDGLTLLVAIPKQQSGTQSLRVIKDWQGLLRK
jgi:serine/threonine protein kinase